MQSLFNLKFACELDRALYEMVMIHAAAAEKLGPGAFNQSLQMLLEKLEAGRWSDLHSTIDRRCVSPRVPVTGDIASVVERYAAAGGPMVSSMIQQALRLAGFAGRIIVEKTSASVPSVELVRGYAFDLQQLFPVDVSFTHPRVACIDGVIEDVSEVHHLLEAASAAKEPCIVFLRGLSDDVKHTLRVNYDRGSLRVVPLGVRFDLDGMNTLVDLSIVTGADLISSLKGDLISAVKFNELPYVDQVTVFRGRVVIMNPTTHPRVGKHLAELRARRSDPNLVADVGRLLDARIKSLSPNHVIIRLPDDQDFVVRSQAIDYALRAVRSIIEHGIMADGLPVTTEIASQVHADRCWHTLASIGAYLA
jgi:chaperonin GroEL (HSP60 family)